MPCYYARPMWTKEYPKLLTWGALNDLPTPSILGPDLAAASAAPVTYDPSSTASVAAAAIATSPIDVNKRDLTKKHCSKLEPDGTGSVPGDGSVAAYLDSSNSLPPLLSLRKIENLTYKVLKGSTYDVDGCVAFCNSVDFCLGFNIFYERDPKYTPGTGCANPEPVTNIKCALYGYPVAGYAATNVGQWRGSEDADGEASHAVIVGSNSYSRASPYPSPAAVTGFTGLSALFKGAINALANGSTPTSATKSYNHATAGADGTYKPCNFFNSYMLSKNNIPQTT
ncbi:hypothetical protein BCR34DRAFT_605139 [Clohesyomyces aquaticus]|uniref:Apple domain-containing protein n=1 Tax=Clohesyomyces aquaticus TaxID=1231657 RepID=A0A1Y1Z0D3_9PLEO|nr:hypothetical protein BCR34DRAFT_605139 [Clohesyomyces aquaticus]